MSECPEIVVYYKITGLTRAPVYVARFWQGNDFLPMIFSGDTPASVEAAARKFWSDETARRDERRARVAHARTTRLQRVREGSA